MEYPKLRQINALPVKVSGKNLICLQDPFKYSKKALFIPEPAFFIISLFDGHHSIRDIQTEYMRRYGELLYSEHIEKMIKELDSHLFLDNKRFEDFKIGLEDEFKQTKIRKAHNVGFAYNQDPKKLKEEIENYLNSSQKSSKSFDISEEKQIKGMIAPHIDYRRGGQCYGTLYREINDRIDAELFLIFGTAHLPTKTLFILTRKSFETPLGIMETDCDFIDKLEKNYSGNLYEDEFVHKTEHSIEFQVVFLQHLFNQKKKIKMVPILIGSFLQRELRNGNPSSLKEFSDFIEAIKSTIFQNNKKEFTIAAADLSHVGPQFGDPYPVTPLILQELKSEDLRMLNYLKDIKLDEFSKDIYKNNEKRHICGYSCIYTMLSTIDATEGHLLQYEQTTDPNTHSTVTFAAMLFS